MRNFVEKVVKSLTITTDAHAANDAVTAKFEIEVPATGAFIDRAVLIDTDGVEATIDLYLFEDDFTGAAANAALSLVDGDSEGFLAKVTFSNWVDIDGAYSASTEGNLGIPFEVVNQVSATATGQTRKLYGQLATTSTPTFTSTDALTLKLYFATAGNA